ncbi:MAG: hypothetical protein LBM18_00650 [Oscillospiraceae bacterium]|jgi:phosphopantetheinyl transferase|nr:hypothetical protein [Oscillospiraceae bacterium]
MKIYYADITGSDEALAKYPPLSESHGSAWGVSLLAFAYADYMGGALPRIARTKLGKPFFETEPQLHFSISHSRTHVLVALSSSPVGADTTDHRPIRPETVASLTEPEDLHRFTFHQLWALREAYFKLTGEGDLRTARFYIDHGRIKSPNPEVFCRLYPDIKDSSTAICSFADNFPKRLIPVPIEKLLKEPSRLS